MNEELKTTRDPMTYIPFRGDSVKPTTEELIDFLNSLRTKETSSIIERNLYSSCWEVFLEKSEMLSTWKPSRKLSVYPNTGDGVEVSGKDGISYMYDVRYISDLTKEPCFIGILSGIKTFKKLDYLSNFFNFDKSILEVELGFHYHPKHNPGPIRYSLPEVNGIGLFPPDVLRLYDLITDDVDFFIGVELKVETLYSQKLK